jgi:hypothetical protein
MSGLQVFHTVLKVYISTDRGVFPIGDLDLVTSLNVSLLRRLFA